MNYSDSSLPLEINKQYHKIKYSFKEEKLQGNTNVPLIITRTSNFTSINGIIISCCDVDHITTLDIYIDRNIIWTISFKLLMKISTVIDDGAYYYVTFNDLLLCDNKFELAITNLIDTEPMYIYLHSSRDVQYYVMTSNKYCSNPEMILLQNMVFNHYVTGYQSFNIKSNMQCEISPSFVSTGMFIETKSPIYHCQLLVNGIQFIDHDAMMIKFYKSLISIRTIWTKKHTLTIRFILNKYIPLDIINEIELLCKNDEREYLYWIPFCSKRSYFDTNNDATFNLSIIDSIKVLVNTKEYYDCKVHVQNKNILTVANGIARMRFTS